MKKPAWLPKGRIPGMSSLEGRGRTLPILLLLLALLSWGAGFSLRGEALAARAGRELRRARFHELVSVLREYSALRGTSPAGSTSGEAGKRGTLPAEGDLLASVSNVVAAMGLRSNMLSLSSTTGKGGRNAVSITLEGLSSDSLATFVQETEQRGMYAFSAEIRAVRGLDAGSGGQGKPRTLTAVLLLGWES